VVFEAETASNTGIGHYPVLNVDEIGHRCDLGLVVGGDGTMLGIGRRLARFGTPLIGINQGRLGLSLTFRSIRTKPRCRPCWKASLRKI
jgi:NAD+ kinase